ncbi:angiopoietin-related protein 7-like isoform X2 [Argopecten irradians]
MQFMVNTSIQCLCKVQMMNGGVASYNSSTGVCKYIDASTHTETETMYAADDTPIVLASCLETTCSGVYQIAPYPGWTFSGYCDADTTGGPWTVIQNRHIGDVDFFRNWNEYKNGFGNIDGDFWIGNDNLHRLTADPCVLRVELEDWAGNFQYIEYTQFQVANEANNYRLSIGGYSGNVYDAMAYHHGKDFCTVDRDNDEILTVNCALISDSGWWMSQCTKCNLNSIRTPILPPIGNNRFIEWFDYLPGGSYVTLKNTKMMIRN